MASPTAVLVRYVERDDVAERIVVAGFLAGYTGGTRVSYTTDLRLFADWCASNVVRFLEVKRPDRVVCPPPRSEWADAFHRRPPSVDVGQLLPLLPRRRRCSAGTRRRTFVAPGSITSPTPSAWIATSSAPCSSKRAWVRAVGSRSGCVVCVERVTDLRSVERRRRGCRRRSWTSDAADRTQGRQARHDPARPAHRPIARPLCR
jgi:hypothetical protein